MNIQIAPEEWQAIVHEGTQQLQQSGKVTRTKVRDALGMNNYDYEHKIKPVCDKLG